MLPGSEHSPARVRESVIDGTIARDVARELRPPIVGIRSGLIAVNGAGMPEAAIDENGQSRSRERDVSTRNAICCPDWKILAETQAPPVKLRAQCSLWPRVSSRVAAHALADV